MIRVLISVLLTGYLLPGILYAQDSPENTKPIVGPATTTTITDARRERIAKIIGYSAGRLQTDERDSDNSREGATGFLDFLDIGPSSSRLTPRVLLITSRKWPVPAAHLSFITKLSSFPDWLTLITLASWPPMSITVRIFGLIVYAPKP